jgi:hypothetical protein
VALSDSYFSFQDFMSAVVCVRLRLSIILFVAFVLFVVKKSVRICVFSVAEPVSTRASLFN